MKKLLILILVVLVLALSMSCSSNMKKNKEAMEIGYIEEDDMTEMEMIEVPKSEEKSVGGSYGDNGVPTTDEKIITTSNIYISTTEFDTDSDYILNQGKSFGGKIDFISKHTSDHSGLEMLSVTLRIPNDKMEDFMNSMRKKFPEHMDEQTSSSNVTREFRDTQTRINVLEDKLKRLRELLSKAEEVGDILEIENNISYTIEELEIQKGSLKYLENQVQYSTAYIELRETKSHAPSNADTSFSSKIAQAFKDMGFIFVDTMKAIIIALIYAIPYIIIVLIGLFIYFKFFKNKRKKNNKILEKKKEEDNV